VTGAAEAPVGDAPAEEQFDESVWDAEAKGPMQLGEDETITVTVDRRKRDIQDYAGSAQAFSQQDLERTGVNSVRDLANATPYMEIGNQEGNLQVYMRGVGTDYGTELGDLAAAVHFDGIYVPRPRGVGSMFFDIERIEVNRGPQGTLRGRNATAGTLNLISVAPQLKDWDSMVSVQLGNYSQKLTKAVLNIPVGDTLAFRFATFTENRDPFYNNAGPVDTLRAPEDANTLAYRISAKWQPVDAFSVTIRHDYTQENGVGTVGSNFKPALDAGILPEEVPDPRALQLRGSQGWSRLTNYGVSGSFNADFGAFSAELLSGYRATRFKQNNSGNAGVAFPGQDDVDYDKWDRNFWHTESDSTVQELRFFAPDDARIRWSFGGNYFYESQYATLATTADKSTWFAGIEYNMPDIQSYAAGAFADATFDIIDALRGTLGIRYTWEMKKRMNGIGYVYGFNGTGEHRYGTEGFSFTDDRRTDFEVGADVDQPPFTDFLDGVERFGQRDTIQTLIQQEGITGGGGKAEQNGRVTANYPDFRVGLDYDLTKDSLIYGMFSTGHKSGGFNDNFVLPGFGSIAATFGAEKVYATELGTKNQFFDKKLTVNAAAFWYEYLDQQFSRLQSLVPTDQLMEDQSALSSVRFNAGNSRILGLEADIIGRLPAGFVGKLSGMLLDARFVKAEITDSRLGFDPNTELINVDLAGNYLPKAPVLSITYGIEQVIPTQVGYFDWMVRATTKTKQYMLPFNGEGTDTQGNVNPSFSDVVPANTRVDAAIGYAPESGAFRVDGFVSNLTDQANMTAIINDPGLNLRFFNTPRQYGIRLTSYLL
jgi:iron complex outermembrane recepter protein